MLLKSILLVESTSCSKFVKHKGLVPILGFCLELHVPGLTKYSVKLQSVNGLIVVSQKCEPDAVRPLWQQCISLSYLFIYSVVMKNINNNLFLLYVALAQHLTTV